MGWSQVALSDKYRQRAEDWYAESQYDSATKYYKKAYELVRHSDPVRAANLCVDLSSIDYMKGHNRVATDRCIRGLNHIGKLKSAPDSVRFKLFSGLGTYYIPLYRQDSALYYFRKADVLLEQNPRIEAQIPLYVLYHFNNQGSWFFKLGNYSRSLTYLDRARKVATSYNWAEDIAFIESNIAECCDLMGELNNSLNHRQLANQFYHKQDLQKCKTLSGIGWALYKLNRTQDALTYYSKAEQLMHTLRSGKHTTDYTSDQIHLWRMISTCYRALNQLPTASQYIKRALQLNQKQPQHLGGLLARVLIEQGEIYEAQQQPEKALAVYQAALRAVCRDTSRLMHYWQNPSPENSSDESTLLSAATHKANLLAKLYKATPDRTYQQAAIATYRFAISLQQRIRHGIDTDQSQVIFSAQQHELMPNAIATTFDAYQQQPTAELRAILLQFFEEAQAGSLREALHLNTIKPQTIPATLLDREQQLKTRISYLKKQPPTDSTARDELTAKQIQWHQLVETFRQDYPAYYQLNYQTNTLTPQNLQQKLDPQTAYVAYVRQGNNLYILTATNQSIDVIRKPLNSARFDQQLARLKQQLYTDPVLRQYEGAAYAAEIYATCIEPIRAKLTGKTRLVVCRDWSFNFLPFEVLETGRQAQDYLYKHMAIAYSFSAQSVFAPTSRPISLNPVLTIAPFARPLAVGKAANRQGNTQTLASSEVEARTIGGDVLLGSSASLANFLKTNLERNIIFFATHAATDDVNPANSYIAFYPGESDKLYADDIYNLSLSATGLVVLGACETGSGRSMKGEGILSLARAFAYAGCPAVVTTLWKANDETTSFLSIRLHHYVSEGMPVDIALQRARQDFFESPLRAKYNHPYYWANYTLLGQRDAVMAGNYWSQPIWWIVIAGLIGALLIWQRADVLRWLKSKKQKKAVSTK
ncbi:CHAT domain-containing protein [Spirosoma daeguense]